MAILSGLCSHILYGLLQGTASSSVVVIADPLTRCVLLIVLGADVKFICPLNQCPAGGVTLNNFPMCIVPQKQKTVCDLALFFDPGRYSCTRLHVPSSRQSGRWS